MFTRFIKLLLVLMFSLSSFAAKEEVKVGLIFDYSGKTRDVARAYLRGLKDYLQYYSSQKNSNVKFKVFVRDSKYNPELALKHYQELKKKGVKIMHAWGTGSCLRIKDHAEKDKIVVFTASYDELLSTPSKSPYTFFMGASYTDQAIIALRFIKEQKPDARIAIIYNTTSFGKSPFFNDRFKNAVARLKLNLVAQEIVELSASDATEQMKSLKKQNIDYAIIQDATKSTVAILSSANKVGLKTKLIGLNWAFNENIMGLVDSASEGYMGLPLFPQPSQDKIEGVKEFKNYLKTKGKDFKNIPSKYVAAWATGMVMAEGVSISVKKKIPLLNAFEKIENFDTKGLTSPVTFTNSSHSGLTSTKIYVIKNKEIIPFNNKVYSIY